eukprot:PhM_4_TR5565/c0_g1_i1/m.69062
MDLYSVTPPTSEKRERSSTGGISSLVAGPNETAPLLVQQKQQQQEVEERTPLPLRPTISLILIFLNEAICISVLFPFIGYLVDSFHLTSSKDTVGYYAGVVVAAFQIAMSIASPLWGRFSDRYGRRPAMLLGLFFTAVTLPAFGFSTNLYFAIGVRFFTGLFCGNIGIAQAYVGEFTDKSNESVGYALLGCCWGLGTMIGPSLGGLLYDPASRWPSVFGKDDFIGRYPALLPCVATSVYSTCVFFVSLFFLPETNEHARPVLCFKPSPVATFGRNNKNNSTNRSTGLPASGGEEPTCDVSPAEAPHHLGAWELLTGHPWYAKAVAVNFCHAFIGVIFYEDFNFWGMATHKAGGLNMSTAQLGIVMLFSGLFALPTPWILPFLLKYCHSLTLCRISIFFHAVLMFLLPCVYYTPNEMWLYISLGAWMFVRANFASFIFSLTMTYITNTAPKNNLALAHGVAQTLACVARAIAPALGGAMIAWSLENGLPFPLNFHFVYVFSSIVILIQLALSYLLKAENVERLD